MSGEPKKPSPERPQPDKLAPQGKSLDPPTPSRPRPDELRVVQEGDYAGGGDDAS